MYACVRVCVRDARACESGCGCGCMRVFLVWVCMCMWKGGGCGLVLYVCVEGRREGGRRGRGGWGVFGGAGGGGGRGRRWGVGWGLLICFSALNVLSADTLEHILTSLLHILLISYKAEMYMLIVCLLFIKWILTSLFVQE